MRVEQQKANIVDVLQQSIGPQEQETPVWNVGNTFADSIYQKNGIAHEGDSVTSVNMKDATYLKPGAEEKKTAVEEMQQADTLDATERKNQMAVLANTTTPEDYARMQEDGFSIDETSSNTIVTETDKIKAELAKAGVDISYFGDDLDMAELEAITGSKELAMQLVKTFEKADIPCTEENVREVMEALELAGALQPPTDGATKYLIDNELEPTIENLYRAEYSGNYQSSGNTVDMSSFMEQVEKIIYQAGLTVNEQTVAQSKWLLENDLPLNEENLTFLNQLENMTLPMDEEVILESIATAISEGERPKDAMLIAQYTLAERAEETMSVVTQATDEDLNYVIERGMDVNVKSLAYAIAMRNQAMSGGEAEAVGAAGETAAAGVSGTGETAATGVSGAGETAAAGMSGAGSLDLVGTDTESAYTREGLSLLTARRQLEEVRLMMTTEANYLLLKRGIQIDTVPLSELVEELKATENAYYENLLRAQGAEVTEENVALFRETTETVSELKSAPAYVLGMREIATASVREVNWAGKVLKDTFERANEHYETLMTAPRADLGDSIQKAFRNVDDILRDLGLETSEANRRAVRILGYNEINITTESIAEMKAVDEQVQRAFKNMTPATVVEMIKSGVNPLDMNFAELNQVAEQINAESGTTDQRKFSEYLWKLEKNHEISEEERAAYIGTYRLIHQVEKSDGAAIGALVQQGAEITMRNLMMAVRSERRSGKMDFSVDESFGENQIGGYVSNSITEQMEAGYQNNCLKDVADSLTPEKLRTLMQQQPDWENMTPEQLKEALANANVDESELDYAYAKEQLDMLSESAKVAEDIYNVLEKYDIPNTMLNVLAIEAMVKNRNGMFRKLFGDNIHKDGEVGADELAEAKQSLLDEFYEALGSPEELGEVQEKLGELAENVMKGMIEGDEVTSLDVREMRLLSAQLSVNGMLAKEEQYSVPVLTGDGVVNVSLKIVRGVDKKGVVDIMMESELRGKIAATFQAKDQGIQGLIATELQDTKALLEEQNDALKESLGEEAVELRYAHISDLDLNQFSMGMFGVDATVQSDAPHESEAYQVQTTRLYQIAESFIKQMREVL